MPSSKPVRLHELRQLALGELDGAIQAELERRLASDPSATERLARLKDELTAFEAQADVGSVSAAIVERLEGAHESKPSPLMGRLRQSWPVFGTAAAAAVALAVMLPSSPPASGTRTKGSWGPGQSGHPCAVEACPVLEMFVKDADGVRPGTDGMTLHAGDWVQFRYRAGGHRYLFIVSVDDDGVIAPLYPDDRSTDSTSIPIDARGRRVLEGSVILDDAIGPERLYAFFSQEPLGYTDVEKLLEAVRDPERQATLPRLPPQVDQTSILIYKEAR